MTLLFLASLAGLFPAAVVPVGVGWKALSAFDLCFAAAALSAGRRGMLTGLDRRLVAAAGLFCGSGYLALAFHPSAAGVRSVIVTTYSVAVFVLAAHFRIDAQEVRRMIGWPLGIALVLAWAIFVIENSVGLSIGANSPRRCLMIFIASGGSPAGTRSSSSFASAHPSR